MMWVREHGQGHMVVSVPDVEAEFACSRESDPAIDEPEIAEVDNLQARPFGVDTCKWCHQIVKGWMADPSKIPAVLHASNGHAVTPPQETRRLTAAERAAAIHGATPAPDNAPDTAPAAPALSSVKGGRGVEPGSDEDMGWPDEEEAGGTATVEGALVVVPEAKPRRASRKKADDIDIDTD